jgi:hypothetical protein
MPIARIRCGFRKRSSKSCHPEPEGGTATAAPVVLHSAGAPLRAPLFRNAKERGGSPGNAWSHDSANLERPGTGRNGSNRFAKVDVESSNLFSRSVREGFAVENARSPEANAALRSRAVQRGSS